MPARGGPPPLTGTNRLKRRLAAGELGLVSGNHESADAIDYAGSLGLFDGVWIDMEHGSVPMERLGDLSRAADLWGLTAIVRVRSTDPALIALTLDQGVHGVIVPHVETRAQAEAVVSAAKFPPEGRRGAAGGRRSYGRAVADQFALANAETFVAVMIEDATGIANLPDILLVPGIDMFFVSRYDLSLSLGLGGAVRDPEVLRRYDGAIETIVRSGRVAAAVVGEADLDRYLALGVRCVKAPLWQALAAQGARSFVSRVESATRPGPAGTGSPPSSP